MLGQKLASCVKYNSFGVSTKLLATSGLAVRAGIPCYFSWNRSPDLVEDEVKFF
jgi:hypothetical protein